MKYFISLLAILISLSCDDPNSTELPENNNAGDTLNLDWLIGNWIRENDASDKMTYEHWIKSDEEVYIGVGYTLQNNDTVFKEDMRLIKLNEIWNLEVSGINDKPTLFKFVELSKNKFVCENKENEFPKKIEYSIQENVITAIISDEKNEIIFIYKKL